MIVKVDSNCNGSNGNNDETDNNENGNVNGKMVVPKWIESNGYTATATQNGGNGFKNMNPIKTCFIRASTQGLKESHDLHGNKYSV